jgi:hypothetical protein
MFLRNVGRLYHSTRRHIPQGTTPKGVYCLHSVTRRNAGDGSAITVRSQRKAFPIFHREGCPSLGTSPRPSRRV